MYFGWISWKSSNPSLDNWTLTLPDKLEEWYDELYDCDEDGKVAIGLVGPTDQELAVLLLPNPSGEEEAVAFELVLVHRHRDADAQGQQERADIPDPLHPFDALGREIGHLDVSDAFLYLPCFRPSFVEQFSTFLAFEQIFTKSQVQVNADKKLTAQNFFFASPATCISLLNTTLTMSRSF